MKTKIFTLANMKPNRGLKHLQRLFPQVLTVQDADVAVEVQVTPTDSTSAVPQAPAKCALAQACVRELAIDGAIIGMKVSYLIKGTHALRFDTPERVAREIVSFDRHHDFAPGIYGLGPVTPSRRFGYYKAQHKETGQRGPRRERKILHRTARVRVIA